MQGVGTVVDKILRSNFDWTIWWWQLGCKDVWIPEITDRFGWSVKIKSMQEELCLCIWAVSFKICGNSLQDVNESNFATRCGNSLQDVNESNSVLLISSDQQEEALVIKSPVNKIIYGFL